MSVLSHDYKSPIICWLKSNLCQQDRALLYYSNRIESQCATWIPIFFGLNDHSYGLNAELSHAETPVPPSFSACPCLNLWFYSWNCLKSCSILSLVDFFLPFDPLIFRCFPGAERLQSEPLETLAPRRFVALWRYEELRHQLRGRRRARKHLKLQPCLASPWGILDGENGSCFFFCGYGIMI